MNQLDNRSTEKDLRFAFVQSCWHREIVDQGRDAFLDEMARGGVPSAAIDLSFGTYRGSIYTVWATSGDAYPGAGATFPAAIWFSRSVDGGGTWSSPRRLSDTSLSRDAMFPSIACDPATGEVLIAWLDRRDDPENRLARVYATRSNDGGASFAQSRAFTSTLDLTGSSFVGHYNGTGAHDGLSLTAFSDAAGFMGVTPLSFDEPKKRHRAVKH